MDSRLILMISLQIVLIHINSGAWAMANSEDGAWAMTNSEDAKALKRLLKNHPLGWVGNDPCGSNWEGIDCSNNRVLAIKLPSMDLKGKLSENFLPGLSELEILDLSYNKDLTGTLPSSIGNLKKLTKLILMGCGFHGQLPDTIGSLSNLVYLSLNANGFTGNIPPSIGNLSKLQWLDITDNQIGGTIPVSSGATPGLDMLTQAKHFHFGNNKLSGSIPPQLFSSMLTLEHLLLDGNQLTGSIPSSLGLVESLTLLYLHGNSLSGPVPANLSNLKSLEQLLLSNNKLSSVPNLTGMVNLTYVDMSNNSFDMSNIPPWISTLQSLTSLIMENTNLKGEIPGTIFSLPQLQTLILKGNHIDGTLEIGSNKSTQLKLVDLQGNYISEFSPGSEITFELILVGNLWCDEHVNEKYCISPKSSLPYPPPAAQNCRSDHQCGLGSILSPNCRCAYPYTGILVFRGPFPLDLGKSGFLEKTLMDIFQSLPVDSFSMTDLTKENDRPMVGLKIFPKGQDRFNATGKRMVASALSNYFSAYSFIADPNLYLQVEPSPLGAKNTSTKRTLVGVAAGASLLVLLLLSAGVYAFLQKRKAEKATEQNNPFAKWEQNKRSGSVPQLKGARRFTFEEIKKYTSNFSEANEIGCGGYGKVYRGILPAGHMVAIKRANLGSVQGGLEFKTEIELLSRVHHKNVVGLVGFCFERGEQMLVYEYVPNGSLRESLSGKSGIKLSWESRLKVTLGSARGLAYLHEHAEPPIIHRDIKSSNILLDGRLNAKVADFGLCKLLADVEKGHVTTQVKGTMGYLDPEYYMSQQLTEKSDVYSFGVLMLEMISARKKPIMRGKHIVKEVKAAMDKTKDLYNLEELLDPTLGTTLGGFNKFVDLALRCVEDSGADRPSMGEVVKEMENIMELTCLHSIHESSSASASYEESIVNTGSHPYGSHSPSDNRDGHSART